MDRVRGRSLKSIGTLWGTNKDKGFKPIQIKHSISWKTSVFYYKIKSTKTGDESYSSTKSNYIVFFFFTGGGVGRVNKTVKKQMRQNTAKSERLMLGTSCIMFFL